MAGKFTVAVDNEGILAAPFNNPSGKLNFISKNGIAKQDDLNSAVNRISANETNISNNTNAINAINDTETGILAQAKAYTNTQIGNIIQFNISVVDELPTTDIKTNTIYLVPASNTEDKNVRDEYLYIKNEDEDTYEWEQIGTTAINLDPINDDIATNTADIATNANNIKALMDAFPTEKPNIIDPKSSLSLIPNTLSYEVGTVADITITSVFTPATYSPKYEKDKFNTKTDGIFEFCGEATSCQWQGSLYSNLASLTSTNVFSNTISKTFSEFTTYNIRSYTSYETLDTDVYNNKGETTGVDQPSSLSGSISSTVKTLYGTLPIYGTTSTIDKLTKQSTQIKSNQSTVEITLVAQTNKDNLQMILIPQDWCGDDGVLKIEQYDSLFNTYNVITNNFAQLVDVLWESDGSAISIPNNDYITNNYLYPNKGPIDTSRKYVLLINTSGTVGERKLRITK